jgi:hypothetical protein
MAVSVRCSHYCIAGASGDFDLGQQPPAGVGHTYGSIESAKAAVSRGWASATSFWQFRIIDVTGASVATGFRTGPGGTGHTIGWRP